MCGIAGMALGEVGGVVERRRLLAMSAVLRHRGPDDEGLYLQGNVGLAVRRLAVIDVRGGRQPVTDETGTIRVVFNGEIYNHARLRTDLIRRGHRFASHCDSEIIPHMYEEYGADFAIHLEGMFAIALWDGTRRRLLLARDRLGIKPLYYTVQDKALVFGSELKALLAADVKSTVDAQAVSDYLSLMYISGSRSIFSQIHKLGPASLLVWKDGGYSVRRYWELPTRQRSDVPAREARRTLRELITANVESQMAADVPVGFFLSGGIDSSAVVAAARQVRPDGNLKTFSAGFTAPSYDERRAAAAVARRFGCEHADVIVEPRPEDMADGLMSAFDEPFADPSMIPTYYLAELARQHVTVALSGDGGDELFAGYLTYKADKIARYYRQLPRALTVRTVPSLLQLLPQSDRRMPLAFKARRFTENVYESPGRSHYLWRVVLREEHKAKLLHPDLLAGLTDSYATHESHYQAGEEFDPLTRFQYTDTKVYLPDDVLVKVDRACMAHSLEVRVPLLATPIVEYAFSLPGRRKMPGYQPKQLLREALTDVLPPDIIRAPKKGFNAPLGQWLRTCLRPLLHEYLSADVLRRQGYLQVDQVTRLVGRHLRAEGDHGRELWALLVLSMWAEKYHAYRYAHPTTRATSRVIPEGQV